MSKEMLLEIVTPQGVVFSKKVTYIKAPGVVGGFGILPDHIPFYSVLTTGTLEFELNGRNKMTIRDGILECIRNKITILTKSAEVITN